MNEEFEMPQRPKGIILVSFFCLLGAIYEVLGFYAYLKIGLRNVGYSVESYFNLLDISVSVLLSSNISLHGKVAPFRVLLISVLPILEIIIIIIIAIGIYLGLRWGRKGLIIFSIWKFLYNPLLVSRFTIEPAIILMFVLWYFRQPNVLEHFGIEKITYPGFLTKNIGLVPVDLAIALILSGVYIVLLLWQLLILIGIL
jgi:hypothetical protein